MKCSHFLKKHVNVYFVHVNVYFVALYIQIRYRKPVSPNSFSAHNFAAILPGDSVAGVVVANGILNFLNIYNSLLVIRLVLTWFPNSPPAIVAPLR